MGFELRLERRFLGRLLPITHHYERVASFHLLIQSKDRQAMSRLARCCVDDRRRFAFRFKKSNGQHGCRFKLLFRNCHSIQHPFISRRPREHRSIAVTMTQNLALRVANVKEANRASSLFQIPRHLDLARAIGLMGYLNSFQYRVLIKLNALELICCLPAAV